MTDDEWDDYQEELWEEEDLQRQEEEEIEEINMINEYNLEIYFREAIFECCQENNVRITKTEIYRIHGFSWYGLLSEIPRDELYSIASKYHQLYIMKMVPV